MTYRYTLDGTIRTRRQVNEVGAQSCSRRVQQQPFPHTHDLDIENCSFVLLVQIIDKLQPTPPMPNDLKKALLRCAHERDVVCRDDLKVDATTGKKLLQAVLNGSALHAPHEANEFLKLLQKAAIYIRWLACSVLPDVYTLCKDDPKRKYPEASVVHFMWTAWRTRYSLLG